VCHAARERLGKLARPARELQNSVFGAELERRDERRADRRVDGRERLALGLPGARGGVPAPPCVVGRVYAVTPENCVRIELP
jgi:hypothetical protein